MDVWAQGSQQFVELRGRHSPAYDGVGIDAVVFSPDSTRLAYAAQRGRTWVVITNGRESRPWDGIGEVVFSPDSKRLAYAAEDRGRWHVVLDGEVHPAVAGVLRGTLMFSPDSRRFAYVAERAGAIHVVVDGAFSAGYDGIGALMFSPDSQRVAFLVRSGGFAHAVIDGAISPAYRRLTELSFNSLNRAGYLAERVDGQFAVIDGQRGPRHRQVEALRAAPGVNRNGSEWAYIVRHANGSRSVYRGGRAGTRYEQIDPHSLRYSPDGRHLAYAAARGTAWYAVFDGREFGPYDAIDPVEFVGEPLEEDHAWGFVAHVGSESVVVLGSATGRIVGERRARWAGNLRFADHGRRHGYLAQIGEQRSVVLDGVQHGFELVVDGSLLFSRDGRHWACLAAVDRSGRFWLVIDGRKRAPFDLVEVMYMMAGDPYGAMLAPETEGRMRAIVAAELARFTAEREPSDRADPERIPTIEFAPVQPTPAVSRFPPARALALGASLGFTTADASPGQPSIAFTDLVLLRAHLRYASSRRVQLTADLSALPKQPGAGDESIDGSGDESGDESIWQGGELGVALAPLPGRAPGLSLAGRVSGGPLRAGAGWWASLRTSVELRKRLNALAIAETGLGGDATWLAFDRATDDSTGDSFAMLAASAHSRVLMHKRHSRIAGWGGVEYRLPLAHTADVADQWSGRLLDPGPRVAFDVGLAVAMSARWNLFARYQVVQLGAASEVGASLPVLDGSFAHQQLSFGVIRRYGTGPHSPALAAP